MTPGRTPASGRVSFSDAHRWDDEFKPLTEACHINVLRREEEDVDTNAQLDALFSRCAIEGVLGDEEGLLLVCAVELVVLAMLERTRADSGQRCLENVDLTSKALL